MQKYDAVILAGGVTSEELRECAPYETEALIILGTYPMIWYVYRAVRASSKIDKVVISCRGESIRELFKGEENLYLVPCGEDLIESFTNAIPFTATEKVLVLPTDIPFITAEAIDDFLDNCEKIPADLYYAIVRKETNEARFPKVKRTYLRLRDGVFTGGNLFLIRTSVVARGVEMGKKLVAQRKNPLALVKTFGLDLVWKFVTRRLSIQDAEARFEQIMGFTGRAVISKYAEVGVDVDKTSDLKLAERELVKKRG